MIQILFDKHKEIAPFFCDTMFIIYYIFFYFYLYYYSVLLFNALGNPLYFISLYNSYNII